MTGADRKHREEMRRLEDAIVEDIMNASDTEILAEMGHEHGSVDAAIADLQGIVAAAMKQIGKRKLEAARAAVRVAAARSPVMLNGWSAEKKKTLLLAALTRSGVAGNQITLAARNAEESSEADIDTLLWDLLELGVIDQSGNLR